MFLAAMDVQKMKSVVIGVMAQEQIRELLLDIANGNLVASLRTFSALLNPWTNTGLWSCVVKLQIIASRKSD